MTRLILRGGRIVDPLNARDEIADIAFADGKVAEIGRALPRGAATVVDVDRKSVV